MCSVQLQQQQQPQQLLDLVFEVTVNDNACMHVFYFFFSLLVRFLWIFTFITYSRYVQNVMCMSNVTVRVPEELKGRMKRCKSVNWSEVARKAFEDAARKEEIQCAAEAIKNLRLESKTEWDGAKEIRKWRDAAK